MALSSRAKAGDPVTAARGYRRSSIFNLMAGEYWVPRFRGA